MANKKGDTTRIQAVPDVNKCTNLGCYSMKERGSICSKDTQRSNAQYHILFSRFSKTVY